MFLRMLGPPTRGNYLSTSHTETVKFKYMCSRLRSNTTPYVSSTTSTTYIHDTLTKNSAKQFLSICSHRSYLGVLQVIS